jgi:biopolymer transport protein ExbB/TolQ
LRDKEPVSGRSDAARAAVTGSLPRQHFGARIAHTERKHAMDASSLTQLFLAMGGVAAALFGFNALVGKGPRGAISICALGLFTLAAMLPIALRDPDSLNISPATALAVLVLRMAGAVGLVLGIFDLFQPRVSQEKHPVAQFILGQPLVWGLAVAVNFFALLYQGVIVSPLLSRYCAGHPIEYIEMTVFFVGLAALVLRLIQIVGEFPSLRVILLEAAPDGGQPVGDCDRLLNQLSDFPNLQNTYVVRRLRDAIDYVSRKNSADDLDEHLRHLEELEAVQVNASYSMVRIIIWAIPILGLLGTVIGITIAVANLNPATLEESMTKVTHGLGVAFDHTATALSLTMLLMFAKSAVERIEDHLLTKVDARVSKELVGRFQESAPSDDPNVSAVRRMSEQVIEAVETLAARQAEVWKTSIHETHQQWADVSMAAGHIVKDSLTSAIKDNLEQHARVLGQNALKHADRLESSAGQHIERLDRSAHETTTRLRDGLEKVAELLVEALERHGEMLTTSEKELAAQNCEHLAEVEAALGRSLVEATNRQERLIRESENLLKEMQVSLVEAAGATVRQQEQLVKQSDVLLKVVDATGQITKLEESLTQNLAAVQQAHSFEDMAVNLTAAINLLSARLGHVHSNRAA